LISLGCSDRKQGLNHKDLYAERHLNVLENVPK
jgi:hypothetical protein